MVDMPNNHNLFPLPYWAPALWRVPMPLQLLNKAFARGRGCQSEKLGQSRWLNCFALFEWVAHRAPMKERSSCDLIGSEGAMNGIYLVEKLAEMRYQHDDAPVRSIERYRKCHCGAWLHRNVRRSA